MEKSIELIWKEGFLNEKGLVAPKVNNLYNQKSRHIVARVNYMLRLNLIIIIVCALIFPIIHAWLGVPWQGVAASVLLLFVAWYGRREMRAVKSLNQGETSLDYLKSFDQWLKDAFSRIERIVKFYYPLCFIIAISTVWSVWNKQEVLIAKTRNSFPDVPFLWNVPIFIVIPIALAILAMIYYSDKIYRLDVRLMYGRVLDKLKQTIEEMEELKKA